MNKNNKKSIYKGQIEIEPFKISCAVLDDGTRILVDRSLSNALGIKGSGSYWQKKKEEKGALLPEYISAKYLEPFISEEIKEKLSKPVIYEDEDGGLNEGLPATALIDICDIWQKADKKGALDNRPNAKKAADNAYIIFKGFANVGITALVDEATGYQYDRERNELQKILKQYISEELLDWQQRFPHEFYKQIFRLNGWDYTVENLKLKPSVVGKWTNSYIYDKLPKGVIDELKKLSPKDDSGKRKYHLHRWLTDDVGNPHLDKQITKVVTIMQLSKNWSEFKKNFNNLYGQQSMEFDDDDDE